MGSFTSHHHNVSTDYYPAMGREAVGVFDDLDSLNAAVAELELVAFPRHDISILSPEDPIPTKIAQHSTLVKRTMLVRPEENAIFSGVIIGGGAYAGAITAALVIGPSASTASLVGMVVLGMIAGMLLGGFVTQIIALRQRQSWNRQVRRGGSVLWVRSAGPASEHKAMRIMRKYGGQNIHIHNKGAP